jgi:acetyl/propionyl-CoA carboxylase alpha subunit
MVLPSLSPKYALFLNVYLKNCDLDKACGVLGINKRSGLRILKRADVQEAIQLSAQSIAPYRVPSAEQCIDLLWRMVEDNAFAIGEKDISLKAMAEINKMLGRYAAEKRESVNVNVDTTLDAIRSAKKQYGEFWYMDDIKFQPRFKFKFQIHETKEFAKHYALRLYTDDKITKKTFTCTQMIDKDVLEDYALLFELMNDLMRAMFKTLTNERLIEGFDPINEVEQMRNTYKY